ncbi:sensor histidine kinase [Flavivirga eckloniae]|uniref:histidine kinase n=1 Tax=Flavivirga eckloniae TaxID=1803846 RepID=A0A2K9PX58_9FLAO|nr:HAMP domain-containing sensor histidine kinase [Flavivirga eckloniae]AUP81651.1 two-component sensor histidine kinase [Flavivirga eckloniae]
MNDLRYRWILYIIVFVILSTISVQVYWNYKNYLASKQQLINSVQASLDNAVETYFANLAETNTLALAFSSDVNREAHFSKSLLDSIINDIEIASNCTSNLDTLKIELDNDIDLLNVPKSDTLIEYVLKNISKKGKQTNRIVIKKTIDSTINISNINSFKKLTSKVLISMAHDSLQLHKIDSLLRKDFNRKNLKINYKLSYKNHMTHTEQFVKDAMSKASLVLSSKSTYLHDHSDLRIHFSNETKIILKRILTSILISTLLVLAVISCLFYLLKVIKHQKQLAEIKNDLISNITHEFKTPISTIGVALESIKNFNVIDDKDKTKTYLDISGNQLSKLNTMVEKLLETATLDSESLELQKETYNVTDILLSIVEKHKMKTDTKTITYHPLSKPIMAHLDVFHFENAINNILDNAIKYGGDAIYVDATQNPSEFTVSISDSGSSLTKAIKDKIFEKFYRIPKGNTHDVKGFGIGLYYTKKIIEKHGGTIQLDLDKNLTTFKITLPNE